MKFLDRLIIISLNALIVITVIFACAIILASSPEWYINTIESNRSFKLNDQGKRITYINYFGGNDNSTAQLSFEETKAITMHISDYIKNKHDDFSLEIDNVKINGEVVNSADVFGQEAIKHMSDVKKVFIIIDYFFPFLILVILILVSYLIIRCKVLKHLLFKYTLAFYIFIILLVVLFVTMTVINVANNGYALTLQNIFCQLWEDLHLVFFPFQQEKVEGSIFNDTLTDLLDLNFFFDAVKTILIALITTIICWFGITIYASKSLSQKTKS